MSNDFRSLLSTFQAASSGEQPVASDDASLLEATTQLWRLSQLKTSLNATKQKDAAPTSKPLFMAICLCIVDDLPHADIWKHWIGNGENASLYLHAKHPEKVAGEWTRSKLIGISHAPNWNDVRIVKAMLSLAQEALEDERVTHMYFGTESCLPIVSLQEALSRIQDGVSYLKHYNKSQASRFEERTCWSPVEQYVPSEAIYKALPGWGVLCRAHVKAVLEMLPSLEFWKAFESCWAPEEVYFATALSLLGLLNTGTGSKSLVYVEWNDRARNEEDRAHPRDFSNAFDQGLVDYIREKQGCIFVRKIKHPISLDWWKQCVLGEQGNRGSKRLRNDDFDSRGDDRRHRRRDDDNRRQATRQNGQMSTQRYSKTILSSTRYKIELSIIE